MPTFYFNGRAVIESASFVVESATEEEAKAKAKAGQFDHVDTDWGEMTDWTIDPDTCVIYA